MKNIIKAYAEFPVHFNNFYKSENISREKVKEENKGLKPPKQLCRKIKSIKLLIFKNMSNTNDMIGFS